MESRTVVIGDQTLTITRFRGLKAILAGALVARVMREIPQIQDTVTEFAKEYRETNTVKITPAMAKMPRFAVLGLTNEDFQGQTHVELPEEPTANQIIIAVVPDLFDLARKEVTRFLALIAISNTELEMADDADEVEVALDRKGKELFRHGDIDELLELALVGWEVLNDQILAKRQRLGKFAQLPFLRTLLSTTDNLTSEEDPVVAAVSEEPTEAPEEETPETLPESPPTSSIDSEPPTDGTEEQSSMEPLGTS